MLIFPLNCQIYLIENYIFVKFAKNHKINDKSNNKRDSKP